MLSAHMNNEKNQYLRNFMVAVASSIGFAIVFLAFGLNIFQSFLHFLRWLIILTDFILFLILLKKIFYWINISDLVDGVWAGVVLYCFIPIAKLPWLDNFVDAVKGLTLYILIGVIILYTGYRFRKRK